VTDSKTDSKADTYDSKDRAMHSVARLQIIVILYNDLPVDK